MGEIFLHSFGNGSAYVSNQFPSDDERVILTSLPNAGATLDDIQAFDQNGHSIALPVRQQLVFHYHDSYGAMTINVYFTGGPTPPPFSRFPLWLLFKIRDGNINGR